MKKVVLLLLLFFVFGSSVKAQSCMSAVNGGSGQSSQSSPSCSSEGQPYFIYQIVSFSGSFGSKDVKVMIDDGESIEKLVDKNGERVTFKTPAAALMYFLREGWELYVNGSTVSGGSANGFGATYSTSYWILRKPCTKEEFETAVEKGMKS